MTGDIVSNQEIHRSACRVKTISVSAKSVITDCSQTLYEFRSSNPKALNVLENSGVFETYKLQTNYRSNQEILDFANVLLGAIEANQYANIQLKANSLKPVTLQSFKDAVTVNYTRTANKSAQTMDNLIAHSIAVDTRTYIEDKLGKGEQVAILAPTRAIISAVEGHLGHVYPGRKVVSLVPKKQYDSALFSKFIAKYWDNVTYVPPMNILLTIRRELMSKIPYMSYKSQAAQQKTIKIAQDMFNDFEKKHKNDVLVWQNQVTASTMTTAQMLDEIKKLMISYEIKRNAAAQAVLSAKNAETKNSSDVDDANFVVSTIHSAKGLEFDNVIVYYENDSNMEEADKRMFYVAFTRAKKTEYIFAYGTLASPKIQGDYNKIIKDLTAKAQATAAPPAGNAAGDDADAAGNAQDGENGTQPQESGVGE